MGSRYGKKAYVNGLLIALNVLFFLYLEITGSSEPDAPRSRQSPTIPGIHLIFFPITYTSRAIPDRRGPRP